MGLGPRRQVAADHRGRDPLVERGQEQRARPAVGQADRTDPLRVDERVRLEHVERAGQVPQVGGERGLAGHHRVHEVGVAGVVVGWVPVEPLAEAAQVGGQHDVAAPGELVGVVAVRWFVGLVA